MRDRACAGPGVCGTGRGCRAVAWVGAALVRVRHGGIGLPCRRALDNRVLAAGPHAGRPAAQRMRAGRARRVPPGGRWRAGRRAETGPARALAGDDRALPRVCRRHRARRELERCAGAYATSSSTTIRSPRSPLPTRWSSAPGRRASSAVRFGCRAARSGRRRRAAPRAACGRGVTSSTRSGATASSPGGAGRSRCGRTRRAPRAGGAEQLTGNVWEWVGDPLDVDGWRTVRGGSYLDTAWGVRVRPNAAGRSGAADRYDRVSHRDRAPGDAR